MDLNSQLLGLTVQHTNHKTNVHPILVSEPLSTIVWRCVLGIVPTYLLGLFILTSSCTGRQSLRSASRCDFVVPRSRTAIKQHRAFSIVGPSVWNSLPSEIRSLPRDLSSSFYK